MKLSIIGSRGYPFVYSGYETFIKELVERLINDNIDITVYCHRNLFIERPSSLKGIKLVYIPTIETKSLSQLIHSFLSTLHTCFTDSDILLYVNSANGPFGLIAKLFGKKILINVDGVEWERPKWKGLGAKYFYLSSKLACKIFNVIITDAEEMRNIYLKEFNCNSEVIAYGANIRESNNPSLIEKFNLKQEDYYLIVGRLIPDNNSDLIINEFLNSHSKKKLVVVGDVPYKDKYAKDVKKNDDKRLIFTGYIIDQELLAELYHNCFVYFHGHEYGGTNPTLLKALAYGCSILALDTVFTREVLDGEGYGLFFTKDKGYLTKKIQQLEKDSQTVYEYRKKSRNRIVENYTWDKITNQYKTLLISL